MEKFFKRWADLETRPFTDALVPVEAQHGNKVLVAEGNTVDLMGNPAPF